MECPRATLLPVLQAFTSELSRNTSRCALGCPRHPEPSIPRCSVHDTSRPLGLWQGRCLARRRGHAVRALLPQSALVVVPLNPVGGLLLRRRASLKGRQMVSQSAFRAGLSLSL